MESNFDIIKYICGITDFGISESVATDIAYKRNIINIKEYSELTEKDRDLIMADLLFSLLFKPKKTASISQSHNGFSQSIGSSEMQSLGNLLSYARSLYLKWGESVPELLEQNTGELQWLDM